MNRTLGDASLGEMDDYGEVDLFGLDEFGAPVGLNPLWGGLAGGVVSTGTAMAVRAFTDMDSWAEGIGAGVGLLTGGIMAFFPGSRAAGWTAIATSLATAGLRQLEALAKQAAAAPSAGMGIYELAPGYPVAGVTVEPLTGGLGIHQIEKSAAVAGLGAQMPAELVGNLGQQGAPAELLGLGSHFGSTLFG